MYIFTVENNEITSSKTADIGAERQITLAFDFLHGQFADEDVFQILLNGDYSNNNYSFTNAGYLKFVNVPFDFIEAETSTVTIAITRNGNAILSDSIIVTAQIAGGSTDLSDYYTKEETESLVKSNQLGLNSAENSTDIIALAYDADYAIQRVDLTSNNATLTINPCSGYTPVAGKIPTFEMWVKASTAKTTISVSNSIQVIDSDNMPEEIANDAVYVFVWRFVGDNQLLNFSHTFTDASSSSSEQE